MDILLRQENNFKPPAFHHPDGLHQSKVPATPDVECIDGKPGWAWGPAARRRCVQMIGVMEYRSVKGEWHPIRSRKKYEKEGKALY